MSTTPITNLIAGIESKVGLFLTGFTKSSYGIDVSMNRSKAVSKTYAVLPKVSSQEDSIGALVVNQDFSCMLCDSYNPGKLNDHDIQKITNTLYDNIYALYAYLVSTKCGVPEMVLNTFGLSVGSPEYLEDGVVVIEFTFTIKHRL